MLLKQITLHNIRSYIDEKIIFPRGSLLLCGDIGSGKSTILLAIEFALFGVKRGQLSGSSLLRNGKKDGFVELEFILNKHHVVIKRTLKRIPNGIKQDSGFVMVDNVKTEGTAVELKSKIFELLGYPKELVSKSKDLVFRYTVYTPQEEMKHIIFTEKEERLDILRRVFNIDRYKRLRDNLQVVMRMIRENNKEYQGRIVSLPEKIQQRKDILISIKKLIEDAKVLVPKLKESKEKMEQLNNNVLAFEEKGKRLIELKKQYELKQQSLRNLEEQNINFTKEYKKLETDLSNIKMKIEILKVEFGNIEELNIKISELEINIENSEKDLNQKKENNTIITERVKSLKENIRQYSKETASRRQAEKQVLEKKQELKNLMTVTKHKEDLEKNIERIEKIIERINSLITEKEVNIKNKQKISDDIKEIDKCPTCHQDVSENYKKQMHSESKNELETLNSELKELLTKKEEYGTRLEESKNNFKIMIEREKSIEKVKAEIAALEKSFSEFDLKKNLIKEYEDKIKLLFEKVVTSEILQTLRQSILAKKNNLKTMREEQNKIKDKKFLQDSFREKQERLMELQQNLNSYGEKRKSLFGERTQIEEEIKSLGDIDKNLEEKKKELEALKQQDTQLEIKKAELIKERNTLLKQKEMLEKDINDMQSFKKKMSYLKELKDWLSDYFSNLTVVIEKHIMQRVYNEFNELFKEWFSLLLENDMIQVRLDEEFTPIIEQNGYETETNNLSGGEKTSLALSYRLALNKVINDCIDNINTKDILILDEPTDGFSSEQLDKIRDVLDQVNIPQVIIVSHEAKIETFVDSITRIHKNEHVSHVI
jgi:exonuclease SbcC